MLAVLRQRSYAALWIGGLVSGLGDWFLFIALPFYIYDLTGSALATGGMFIAESLPSILFGSLAGVFVDRWDRQRTMVISDLCRGALLLIILAARSPDRIWVIFAVMFVESSIGQFFGPAKSALIPRLVSETDLVAANSLSSVSGELTRLVGPALGGAVFGLFGLISVVAFDAVSFFFSAIMVSLIHLPRLDADSEPAGEILSPTDSNRALTRVWGEFAAGLRLMGKNRLVAALLVTMGLSMVGQGIINVMLVPFVKDVLRGDALVLGWIASAQGVGGLVGGVLVGSIGARLPKRWLVAGGLVITGLLTVAACNSTRLWLVLALVALLGLAVVAFAVGVQTILQVTVEDRYRGRVFGAYNTIQATLMLLGMALAGALAGLAGTVAMLDLAGAFTLLAGLTATVVLPAAATESRSVSFTRAG